MPNKITIADEPARLASKLIREYHRHLLEANIVYLFTTQKRKSKGKDVFAKADMPNDVMRFFSAADGSAEADFVITFGKEAWQAFDEHQREALVDHELCHCERGDDDKDGEPTWKTRGHDLEEFAEVVRRHGLWDDCTKEMAQAMQMELGFAVDKKTGEVRSA